MDYSRVYILVQTISISLCVVWGRAEAARQCLGRDQCSCVYTDDQSAVILNSLGNSDLTPRFKDVTGSDGNTYSFNPCYPFAEKECSNAAACMFNSLGQGTVIGDPQTAEFTSDDSGLSLGYRAGTGILKVTQVSLVCDMNACTPQLVANGQGGLETYAFTLSTVCACPNGCDETGPLVQCSSGSGSGSSVIGVVFIALICGILVLYIVGGVAYQKFVRKAHGAELIPNIEFWKNFPSLIKSGVLFILSPCLGKRGYSST